MTCPHCQTRLRTRTSRRILDYQQRRMECTRCGYRETVIISRQEIRPPYNMTNDARGVTACNIQYGHQTMEASRA